MLASDSPLDAVDRLERQKVLRANLRNRTLEDGGAPRPLAEFPRNLRCEFCIRLLAHQLQGLLDLLVGDNAEEGRLFQLHGKPLPQRAVKNRVAGRVREIGEDDRVLVRQRVGLAGEKQPAAHGQSDNQYSCASGRRPSKPSGFRGGLQPDSSLSQTADRP